MTTKVIVVTGASRGLGLAIAKHLLQTSHKVVLVSRTQSALQALQAEYPSQVEYLAADLTNIEVSRPAARLCRLVKSRKSWAREPFWLYCRAI